MLELPADDGVTLVVATHNVRFAKRCDRTYRIAGGMLATA